MSGSPPRLRTSDQTPGGSRGDGRRSHRRRTLATLTELECIRKQDLSGSDEPELYVAGLEVWDGKMGQGESSR